MNYLNIHIWWCGKIIHIDFKDYSFIKCRLTIMIKCRLKIVCLYSSYEIARIQTVCWRLKYKKYMYESKNEVLEAIFQDI